MGKEKEIWGWIIGILLVTGFLILFAKALFIPFCIIALILFIIGICTENDALIKVSAYVFAIALIFFVIGGIFGDTLIGRQAQETYLSFYNMVKAIGSIFKGA